MFVYVDPHAHKRRETARAATKKRLDEETQRIEANRLRKRNEKKDIAAAIEAVRVKRAARAAKKKENG